MKLIKFFIVSILIANMLPANPLPVFVINELYFDSEDNWHIELNDGSDESFYGYYLKSESDSAIFLPGLQFDSAGFLLLNNSSMIDSFYIDENGDRVEIIDTVYGDVYAQLYFGAGEKYKAPDSGQSLCRDKYNYGEYYLDNSPSLGSENDTLDACCTISGYVKDSIDNPIDSVKICLNKYEMMWTTCRDTAHTITDGSFELRSLAYAFLSIIEFTKNQYDTTEIDSLDLSPDSTYDLGTIPLTRNQDALPEDQDAFNQFSLSQNIPNPFIGETKITFTLPSELPTLLEVYNSEGRKVKTLVKGIISEGKHEVTLDATSLSSGVYIYKLRAGRHYSDSKKLILTK